VLGPIKRGHRRTMEQAHRAELEQEEEGAWRSPARRSHAVPDPAQSTPLVTAYSGRIAQAGGAVARWEHKREELAAAESPAFLDPGGTRWNSCHKDEIRPTSPPIILARV